MPHIDLIIKEPNRRNRRFYSQGGRHIIKPRGFLLAFTLPICMASTRNSVFDQEVLVDAMQIGKVNASKNPLGLMMCLPPCE
jgi:hypothetical protein